MADEPITPTLLPAGDSTVQEFDNRHTFNALPGFAAKEDRQTFNVKPAFVAKEETIHSFGMGERPPN